MRGMADVGLATLRAEVLRLVVGTIFVAIGGAACTIAAMRWGKGVAILIWLGIWSGLFGLQELIQTPLLVSVLPPFLKAAAPWLSTAVMYLLLVSALCAWRELSLGKLRLLTELEILAGLAIALAGMATFALGGPRDQWMIANHLLTVFAMLVLLPVLLIPKLSRFLVISHHRVLTVATFIFASEVLYTNLSGVFRYRTLPLVAATAFAGLLFSLGYVALDMLFTNERRLLAIETELEMARQIQASILPAGVPEVDNLRIAASYQPVAAVAGDFYQFVRPDNHHLGILIADVSGHGIPAALVSSMIKVAMQSVAAHAGDPAKVLAGLNRILSTEASGQLASAAYLWIDSENRQALYSAAGHPPLLCWHEANRQLQRIESNGLLFGVQPCSRYPVCRVAIEPADRLLLYTDGVTETENAAGEPFGDRQLEGLIRSNGLHSACEFSRQVLSALQNWRPAAASQQDDMTLIVVDVL